MRLILGGIAVGEIMIFRISLRRGSTTEVRNRGLDTAVIEANYWWRKIDPGIHWGEILSMIAT